MTRKALSLAAALMFAAIQAAADEPPQRIVSMNLCTDQYVLLLAARERIRSVSFLAADVNESPLADRAIGLKINYGNAEEIIAEKPDLVLTGEFTTGFAKMLLRRLGYRVVEVENARDIPGVRRAMRDVGRLLGESAKAEAIVDEMDARLADVGRRAAARQRSTALVYEANGFTVGRPSLADDVLTVVGLTNIAPGLGLADYGQLALEDLLIARPQHIVRLEYRPGSASLAAQVVAHPAVTLMTQGRPPLNLPGRLLTCASPTVADAAEILDRQLEAQGS
jgi:iron complex transport system substrate-binding protein